jgi:hypothetical protein
MLIINELYFAKQHSRLASAAGEVTVQKNPPPFLMRDLTKLTNPEPTYFVICPSRN